MMLFNTRLNFIQVLAAAVWLINGLFCKVLDMVPRHQEIVARIVGADSATTLTVLIGMAETGMAAWILLGIQKRLNVFLQVLLVLVMNAIEFIAAPDLLLWGRWNAVFVIVFVLLIYANEFGQVKKISQSTC